MIPEDQVVEYIKVAWPRIKHPERYTLVANLSPSDLAEWKKKRKTKEE